MGLKHLSREIIDDHIRYDYTADTWDAWNIVALADEDPKNLSNIVDLYKNASYTKIAGGLGVYHREHSWPKSYGFPVDAFSNYPYSDRSGPYGDFALILSVL